MTKNEKRAAIITGTLLFMVAAFFSVSIILGILDFGSLSRSSNLAYRFGFMLVSVYGVCSLFIPAFFFVAGCFCLDAQWSLQRMMCLLVSIIPFFTLAFAERSARNIAQSDSSPIAAVKITVLLVIAILLVAAEYLVTLVVAGIIQKKRLNNSENDDDLYISDEEDFSADDGVEAADDDYDDSDDTDAEDDFFEEEVSDKKEAPQDPIEAEVDKKIADAVEDESSWSLADYLSKNRKVIEETVNAEPPALEESSLVTEENIPLETDEPKEEKVPLKEESIPLTESIPQESEVEEEVKEEEPVKEEILLQTENAPQNKTESPKEPVQETKEVKNAATDYESDPWNVTKKAEVLPKTEVPEEKEETVNPVKDDDPWNVTKKLVERAKILEERERAQSKTQVQDENAPVQEEEESETFDEEDDIIAEFERGSVNLEDDEDLISFEAATEETEEDTEETAKADDSDEMEEMFSDSEENDSFMDFPGEIDFAQVDEEFSAADSEDENAEAEDEDDIEDTISAEKENEVLVEDLPLPKENNSQPEKKTQNEKSGSMLSALDSIFARMDADVKANFNPTAPAVVDSNGKLKEEKTETKPEEKKEPVKVIPPKVKQRRPGPYKISTELLKAYDSNPYWIIDEETEAAAENLKSTLREFKIEAEVTGIKKGPVVTMFEILPAPGVKLNKIVALQDNIALRLAAKSVRIVAPIPGKHAVGIEVPNKDRAIISMRECLELDRAEWKKMAVPVILGKDIQGEAQIIDLAKTPHLLIAGSTGAGKSVCVNSMILSILYKRSPNEVKMILIDPKIVELKLYNDIPHLLTPVITEPKRAMQALQYCLCEMERRYALLDHMSVRDISSYNKKIAEKGVIAEKLPYLIVVIDEFADLMATTGKQLEGVLARLAAMSRAVGIHLVLATQRPSIDVITGLIKANIPSRIAFMVAGKMDSRIIIDQVGAEKLLGKGDMLYASATSPFPVRIQGTFVSDQEVEDVVEKVKEWGEPEYIDDEIFVDDDEDGDGEQMSLFNPDGDDPLYEKALEIVVQSGKASASYIQRKLKIGYNRAARLVEEMEERGIVGPANGSKARELIHIP